MVNKVSPSIEEKIVSASKIMDNIMSESMLHEGVEGVSVSQFRILEMIYQGEDKPAEMAKLLGVSPPATTWMFERLEEKGLLERESSEEDRRRILPFLTPKGTKVVQKVGSFRRRYLKKVLKDMDDSTIESLEDSLERFRESYIRLKETEEQ